MDCDFFSVDEYQFYFKEGKIYFDQAGLQVKDLPVHEIRHRVNGLKYPLFNRNTRIKKQLPDDKIEILDAPEIPKKPENNIVMNLMPSITMLGLVVVFRRIEHLGSSGSYVILSVCSMALGIVTTILGFISGNKKYKQDCEERITKYNSYIDKKKEEIEIKRREKGGKLKGYLL